jgi:hypothetical protein
MQTTYTGLHQIFDPGSQRKLHMTQNRTYHDSKPYLKWNYSVISLWLEGFDLGAFFL